MKLARNEVITYVGWLILLYAILLIQTLYEYFEFLPLHERLIYEYSSWMTRTMSGIFILINMITAGYIFVSERRLGHKGFNVWSMLGLVLGPMGMVLYAAWSVMEKADLFLDEDSPAAE